MERYRVRSPIKSFRDLEVYQKTVRLSAEVSALPFLGDARFVECGRELRAVSEKIPMLIAEAYGDRFDSGELAFGKLTEAVSLMAGAIARIDILRERFSEEKANKELLDALLTKYQGQKVKVLNLRKAWNRVFGGNVQDVSGKAVRRE